MTQHKIGGKAKAMLVTRSRLHAVRYKRAFDDYIKKQNYRNLKTLVVFSGTVDDDGVPYTETEMSGINEAELPEKFAGSEYQVLIVAEINAVSELEFKGKLKDKQAQARLNPIIERMNERFGTEFDPQDKLSRDQLVEDMVQDESLKERAQNNSIDNFAFTFEDRFMDFLIDRMTDKNFFQKIMENEEQRIFLMNDMKEEVYHRLREG